MFPRFRFVICVLPIAAISLLSLPIIDKSMFAAEDEATVVARMGSDIRYLASDELEGRGPGTAGLRRAAEYVRSDFSRIGLSSGVADGTYLQPFQVPTDTKVVP
ncbi:MAG: hypothetical protein JJ992_00045, partial [Planctomycetes bacterium]|nr:hypothetical protein [Planctomycetota bacterium]